MLTVTLALPKLLRGDTLSPVKLMSMFSYRVAVKLMTPAIFLRHFNLSYGFSKWRLTVPSVSINSRTHFSLPV